MHLQYELHHLRVNQAVNRLSVHVGDQVSLPEPRLMSRTPVLHMLREKKRKGE